MLRFLCFIWFKGKGEFSFSCKLRACISITLSQEWTWRVSRMTTHADRGMGKKRSKHQNLPYLRWNEHQVPILYWGDGSADYHASIIGRVHWWNLLVLGHVISVWPLIVVCCDNILRLVSWLQQVTVRSRCIQTIIQSYQNIFRIQCLLSCIWYLISIWHQFKKKLLGNFRLGEQQKWVR